MNILLAGVGGQGTVLASKIIAACAINKGIFARTAETIGMAQRGGSVVSHVRIGENVASPLIPKGKADLIIALEPAEAVRVLPYLKKGGSLVVNANAIKPVTDLSAKVPYSGETMLEYLKSHVENLYIIDGDKHCDDLGSSKILNLVLLGIAAKNNVLGFSTEDLLEVVEQKIPEKFKELNKKALQIG